MYIHMYIYIYICISLSLYIYIGAPLITSLQVLTLPHLIVRVIICPN